jgi:hypothetical protein
MSPALVCVGPLRRVHHPESADLCVRQAKEKSHQSESRDHCAPTNHRRHSESTLESANRADTRDIGAAPTLTGVIETRSIGTGSAGVELVVSLEDLEARLFAIDRSEIQDRLTFPV